MIWPEIADCLRPGEQLRAQAYLLFFRLLVDSCQRKAKGGTLSGLRFDRDVPAMPLDNLLADGQSDAGPGVLVPLVQTLEHSKNLLEVLRIDADSVVSH